MPIREGIPGSIVSSKENPRVLTGIMIVTDGVGKIEEVVQEDDENLLAKASLTENDLSFVREIILSTDTIPVLMRNRDICGLAYDMKRHEGKILFSVKIRKGTYPDLARAISNGYIDAFDPILE